MLGAGTWRPSKKSLPTNKRLAEFDLFCGFLFSTYRPDLAAVEVIRVSTSHDTTRILSRFESAYIVRAEHFGARVIEYSVSTARSVFYGSGMGTLQKEQSYAAMRSRYPDVAWLAPDDGGMDQADALLAALAAEEIEQRNLEIKSEKLTKQRAKRKASGKAK